MIQTYGIMFYTREGLPVRCWVFPGNTTDVNTVEKVHSDLRGWSLGRALFVADVERCFRSLKRTQIKMCPMHHW